MPSIEHGRYSIGAKASSGISIFETHGCPTHDGDCAQVDRRLPGEKGYTKGGRDLPYERS